MCRYRICYRPCGALKTAHVEYCRRQTQPGPTLSCIFHVDATVSDDNSSCSQCLAGNPNRETTNRAAKTNANHNDPFTVPPLQNLHTTNDNLIPVALPADPPPTSTTTRQRNILNVFRTAAAAASTEQHPAIHPTPSAQQDPSPPTTPPRPRHRGRKHHHQIPQALRQGLRYSPPAGPRLYNNNKNRGSSRFGSGNFSAAGGGSGVVDATAQNSGGGLTPLQRRDRALSLRDSGLGWVDWAKAERTYRRRVLGLPAAAGPADATAAAAAAAAPADVPDVGIQTPGPEPDQNTDGGFELEWVDPEIAERAFWERSGTGRRYRGWERLRWEGIRWRVRGKGVRWWRSRA